ITETFTRQIGKIGCPLLRKLRCPLTVDLVLIIIHASTYNARRLKSRGLRRVVGWYDAQLRLQPFDQASPWDTFGFHAGRQ
ncbi:hypothetical protein, partial [Mesorhizobium sp.]|uniref:hypothetical protein n=1 Tax=Mesorhizobium sp. TaxID=1871066 RepID=UPI0025BF2292